MTWLVPPCACPLWVALCRRQECNVQAHVALGATQVQSHEQARRIRQALSVEEIQHFFGKYIARDWPPFGNVKRGNSDRLFEPRMSLMGGRNSRAAPDHMGAAALGRCHGRSSRRRTETAATEAWPLSPPRARARSSAAHLRRSRPRSGSRRSPDWVER
jgi:hypothetical protein